MKMKSATTATTKPIEPTTKTSPPTAPRAARPSVNRNRKAPADEQRAVAHAELAVAELAEQGRQPGDSASRAGRWRSPAAAARRGRPRRRRSAALPKTGSASAGPSSSERQQASNRPMRRQPRLLALQGQEQRRRDVAVERIAVEQPGEREEIRRPAPYQGSSSKADPARPPATASDGRDGGRWRLLVRCRTAYCGSVDDLVVPLLQQALALVARAVLLEVVVDQLDRRQVGRLAARRSRPCSTAAGRTSRPCARDCTSAVSAQS